MVIRKELSIDDLVYEYKAGIRYVRKVRQITRKKIGYILSPEHTNMQYAYFQNVFPIELTDEMLRLNGWREVEPSHYIGYGLPSIVMNDNVFKIEIGGCVVTLRFIHSLQNILRLCGKEELADDFKLPNCSIRG